MLAVMRPSVLGALLLLVFVQGFVTLQPPGVVGRGASPDQVSGERAMAIHARVIPDVPHPIGSAAARLTERAILQELERLGVASEVEEHVVCDQECTRVRNIHAYLPGTSDRWVGVSTHYDSVWAGPGAGDDGAGVAAALEWLRAARAREPLEAGVLVLFNEGEEANLYGAKAFVERSPWFERLEALVNLEARGTGGAAYLFEIQGSTRAFARAYAGARRPTASGLYVAIYDMLPNNTDVSVFGQAGLPSANVAFLGGAERYHTPQDDRAHLDPRSVQHLVDQLDALVTGIAATKRTWDADEQDVLFDVGGLGFVHAPQGAFSLGAGVLALVILGLSRPPARRTVHYVSALFGSAGLAIALDLGLTSLGGAWTAFPALGWLLFLPVSIGSVQLLANTRREEREDVRVLAGMVAMVTLCAVFFLPAGAYVCAGGLPLVLGALLHERLEPLAVLAPWLAAPFVFGLPDALGLYGPVVVVPVMWCLVHGAPFWPRHRHGPLVFGVTALASLASFVVPASTPTHPQRLIADVLTDGSSSWLSLHAATFPRGGEVPVPSAPMPPAPLPFPPVHASGPEVPFRPPTVVHHTPLHIEVNAPDGWALRVLTDGANLASIEGEPLHGRFVEWLGDTASVHFTTDRPARLHIAVAHPGIGDGLDTATPVEPIHTGFRTWSLIRTDVSGRTSPR